jgi:dipeptidyl aminopeptidase/acylaminoacyl peptidase
VWAADGQSIYFAALAEGIQGIFNVIPGEEPVRLTSDTLWFDFGSPFGVLQDGTLLTTYASMDFPTELVAVNDHSIKQLSFENEHLLSQLDAHETEARWLDTVDGEKMLTWVLYPPQFDASKTYPAIEICLGGPQGTLSQGWSYRWNYLLMAHQGYVVVLPNRRGTTAFGQPWCEEISGDYIGLNMQDYLTAARNIKAEPYVSGVAACGASYGGYSVYYLAGIHKDVYDCFIAHAGIFNEEHMYFTTEEMWFPNWDNGGLHEFAYAEGQTGPAGDGVTFGGLKQGGSPWSTLEKARRHYANSPHKLVQNWHTPILCMHGGMDFRVPYDEGMAAFNAAQMMGVPSKLVVFPGENHWILKPQNALYWHRTYFGWLDRWMKWIPGQAGNDDQEIFE